ncbi:putative late blight resistance proteinR1A-4 [Abeliophyllum distichum]|uniref:Late blight resistance proteinR1A-4 n=1 Tax=Abeliophyllum distichum TaxID=126358 RepID=A0ABD1VZ01_9LAMI
MMDYKQELKSLYDSTSSESRLDAPMTKIILKDLVDSVLENMKDLQSCETDLIVSLKKHIEALEVKLTCFEKFLVLAESTQSDTLPEDLQTVVSIDSLLDNLMQLRNCNSSFMIPLKDKIAIFHQDLGFMRALLMDPPPRKHDKDV